MAARHLPLEPFADVVERLRFRVGAAAATYLGCATAEQQPTARERLSAMQSPVAEQTLRLMERPKRDWRVAYEDGRIERGLTAEEAQELLDEAQWGGVGATATNAPETNEED